MFILTSVPIEQTNPMADLANPQAGACVTFEGWVRNHNEGKSVLALEYEAYDAMARQEAQAILEEAKARFDILEARCIHRVGRLEIGEMAVWVGVTAAHRGEAFDASEYIIDEIKHRLPIWKKEYYTDGNSGWVNCQRCAEAAHHPPKAAMPEEWVYYARQHNLPEVGPEGQRRLKEAKVLVVGAGGLGSPALLYLAAAGVGTLGISEFDTLDVSNLHRQVLYHTGDIGQCKAKAAQARLQSLNPFITVRVHQEPVDSQNVQALFRQYDVVLDCTDNFQTKFLLNDAAVAMGKPLVQASIYQYEGQLHVYQPGNNAPCLRCLWPTVPEPGCVGTCAEVGVLGAVPGVLGAMQAMETLKLLLGLPGVLARDRMLLMDLLNNTVRQVTLLPQPTCACQMGAKSLTRYERKLETPDVSPWILHPETLSWETLQDFLVVDIREDYERVLHPLQRDTVLVMPFSTFSATDFRVSSAPKVLLVCSKGVRSAALARTLHEQGDEQFYSLSGGVGMLQRLLAFHPDTLVSQA